MASRGKYSARLLRHNVTETDDPKERSAPSPSRRLSATSTASSTSKIPAYTSSFFSRHKLTRNEVEPPKVKTDGSFKKTTEHTPMPYETSFFRRTESPAKVAPPPSRPLGQGITAANTLGSASITPNSEKRQRNVLRRKASGLDQHAQYARTESPVSSYDPAPQNQREETASNPGAYRDPFAGSILGVAMPARSTSTSYLPAMAAAPYHQATSSSRMATYNPQSTSHALSTRNLSPPTASFAYSSGSSTRRSESPGAFSRTSTPTSMSSHSPGIPLPVRQTSPTRSRPPITRIRMGNLAPQDDAHLSQKQGLTALRESGTSSSSSSTIKGVERTEGAQIRNPAYGLSPPPPSPPPRLSSKKFLNPRDEVYQARHPLTTADALQRRPALRTQITEETELSKNGPTQPTRPLGPPRRPSREGTPKLEGSLAPSPIIKSNLSRLITSGHKRRESLDKTLSSPENRQETPLIPRSSTFPVKPPSRLPSPNIGSTNSSRSRTTEVLQKRDIAGTDANVNAARTKDPSPLSAGSSKSSSRFGLFTRRAKSPLETTAIESGEKVVKKGPIAGTGHEGYGKYAKRGRTGSASTSTTSRGRSTSTGGTSNSLVRTPTSRKSSITSRGEPEMDDFLLERLAPVIISGGGGSSESRESSGDSYRKPSEDSLAGRTSHEEPTGRRPLVDAQVDVTKTIPALASTESEIGRRRSRVFAERRDLSPAAIAGQDSDKADQSPRPTLAARRSLHRSQLFKEAEPLKIPAPINTQVVAPSPVLDSYDTMNSSALMTGSTQILSDDVREGREGNWLRPRKPGKRAKSPRKWNFFQRTHVTPKATAEKKPPNKKENVDELPVTISRIPASRPVAHYAMLDSNDQEGSNSTVDLISDVERPVQSPSSDIFSINRDLDTDMHNDNHKYSMLLPSPPKFSSEFAISRGPPSPLHRPEPAALYETFLSPPRNDSPDLSPIPVLRQLNPVSTNATYSDETPRPKQPRLQQVGRIPRVISKRDRDRDRAQAPPPPSNFSRPFTRPLALTREAQPLTARPAKLEHVPRPVLGVQTEILPSRPWVVDDDSAKPASAPAVASSSFSPPARDEFLTFPPRKGSEVSGSSSSGILNFAATTAVVPQPGIVAEDEVWNEYDELLDIIESPPPLVNAERTRTVATPLHLRKESNVTGAGADHPIATSYPPRTMAPTAELPLPPRRSQLLSPPESAELHVSTPLSFSDFFAGYGDRNRASAATQRQSISSGSRYSSRSRLSALGSQHRISGSGSQHSRSGSSGKKRNTQIMAEKTAPATGAETNLRFSALMTSRWLSFGRVLFSPAHMEIQSNRHDRVLVLDGLGNDDWSFYCALTYPNATVYNLSPSQSSSDPAIESPSNHRQIHHASIAHRFPFPKSFFTAAVFRFPIASSEAACYNAISECKRVLRPGGYLEMSILDLDMVNMGNRARRAVRQLKVRMQVADPNISLKPASDNIQKMLGRRGYENLNRCMVNVPIAGRLSDSRAGSFSTDDNKSSEEENNVSLGDMLKDPSARGDEGISKMVAKVGRWWYTRCYEMAVLPSPSDTNNNNKHDDESGEEIEGESIWTDKALLRECEKRETGLKLLICFAQKPSAPKRRTVSM